MTTIAYRDGIMAADSAVSNPDSGMLIGRTPNKVIRLPSGALYGSAGDLDDRLLLAMIFDVKTPDDLPDPVALSEIKQSIDAIFVFPDRRVFAVSTNERACATMLEGEFFALGSGGDIAIGAMAAGASAYQAVEIACEWNSWTRPPIVTVTFE